MSEFLPAPLEPAKLFDVLEQRYTGFKDKVLNSCLVTVNLEYIDIGSEKSSVSADVEGLQTPARDRSMIAEGDEVAIIPPVSSGWSYFRACGKESRVR